MIRKAIILSAGFGKRLNPLTESIPKPLLPVAGIPVIRRTLSSLASSGITEIVINLHHLAPIIKSELTNNPPEVKITYSEEPSILGTAGGIRSAKSILAEEDFIVINSDIIAEINFEVVVKFHKQKKSLCTMVLREDIDSESYGSVEIDHDGKIRRFLGKPKAYNKLLSKYMFTGIQIMSPAFLNEIPPGRYCDISQEIFPRLIKNGAMLYGYVMKGYWKDIGEPARYLEANWYQLRKVRTKIQDRGDGIKTIPPVITGRGIDIQMGAVLGPNSSIGEGCRIESDVEIEESVILQDVSIGRGAKIIRSIIGPSVSIPPGELVAQKIIALVNGKTIIKSY